MAEYLHLAALAAGLAALAALQVITCRLLPRLGWLKSFILGFAAGALVTAALEAAIFLARVQRPGEFVCELAAVGIAYFAAFTFYFNVINGGKSALRVRLLQELARRPEGMTFGEIRGCYSPEEMFATRLERMLGHGQAVLRDGRLHVGRPAMAALARVVTATKYVVLGKRSEFDERRG